jgi:hypothetical protein
MPNNDISNELRALIAAHGELIGQIQAVKQLHGDEQRPLPKLQDIESREQQARFSLIAWEPSTANEASAKLTHLIVFALCMRMPLDDNALERILESVRPFRRSR